VNEAHLAEAGPERTARLASGIPSLLLHKMINGRHVCLLSRMLGHSCRSVRFGGRADVAELFRCQMRTTENSTSNGRRMLFCLVEDAKGGSLKRGLRRTLK